MQLFKINKDYVVVMFIALIPFAFYIYNIAPDTKIWKTSLFEIDSGLLESVNYYFWILSVKFITLIMLSLWFISCTHKWRYLLLASINIEIYKIHIVVRSVNNGLDSEFFFVEILYYYIPFTLILIFIYKRMKYQNRGVVYEVPLNNEINNQITKLSKFDKKDYKSAKKQCFCRK